MRRQLALPCDSVGLLRAVAVAESVSEHFLLRGALVIAVVGAAPRPVVDFSSSLWFVFSRRLAPSRRRLAFRAALLCYSSFYSIALVVEALELAAERFGVLTFVDVHGCCAWEPNIALRCPGLGLGLLRALCECSLHQSSDGFVRTKTWHVGSAQGMDVSMRRFQSKKLISRPSGP